MKHIYFCRHGQSQLNVDGMWAGHTETPLTHEGRLQAMEAGKQALGLGIDHIISSPLSRAHDTAKLIAMEIGFPIEQIELNSLIIERHFGPMETQPWSPDFNMDDFADAETADSILERARLTLKHLETLDADTILVVSHGSFGRALRHIIDPSIPWRSERILNAQIIQLL